MKVSQALTLLELLIVIAIVFVLVAILAPVFAPVRHRTGHSDCLSNVRQIGTAHCMYLQDYDETFAPTRIQAAFFFALYPYTKNFRHYSCPISERFYRSNPILDRISYTRIVNPAGAELLRDAVSHDPNVFPFERGRYYGFADGHAKGLKSPPPPAEITRQ